MLEQFNPKIIDKSHIWKPGSIYNYKCENCNLKLFIKKIVANYNNDYFDLKLNTDVEFYIMDSSEYNAWFFKSIEDFEIYKKNYNFLTCEEMQIKNLLE